MASPSSHADIWKQLFNRMCRVHPADEAAYRKTKRCLQVKSTRGAALPEALVWARMRTNAGTGLEGIHVLGPDNYIVMYENTRYRDRALASLREICNCLELSITTFDAKEPAMVMLFHASLLTTPQEVAEGLTSYFFRDCKAISKYKDQVEDVFAPQFPRVMLDGVRTGYIMIGLKRILSPTVPGLQFVMTVGGVGRDVFVEESNKCGFCGGPEHSMWDCQTAKSAGITLERYRERP